MENSVYILAVTVVVCTTWIVLALSSIENKLDLILREIRKHNKDI